MTAGINNLLMIVAVVLFGAGSSKSRLRGNLRHPMLTGVVVWCVAHLLVNGHLAAVILFGGMGLWALIQMRLINRAEPAPEPYAEGTLAGDIRLVIISAIVFTVIAAIHNWIPEDLIAAWLGQDKWWSVLVATIAGIPIRMPAFPMLETVTVVDSSA